jgi:hypothetical protein
MERETGIEPATNSLEGCDSTTELLPQNQLSALAFSSQQNLPNLVPTTVRRGDLHASRHCAGARFSSRRAPEWPAFRSESFHRRWWSRSKLRGPQTRASPWPADSMAHPLPRSTLTRYIRVITSWCTGKDSNLRTPLGGADLQSAGFNHSPTCAKYCKLRSHEEPSSAGQRGETHTRAQNPFSWLRNLISWLRNLIKQEWREQTRARNHYTSERILMECVQKTCCVTASAACWKNRSWSWRRDLNP